MFKTLRTQEEEVKIAEKNKLKDDYKKLDKKKLTLEERLEYIERILEVTHGA